MNKQQIQQKLTEIQTQTTLLNLATHKILNGHVVVVPAEIKESGITSRAVQFEDRPQVGLVVAAADDVDAVSVGDVIFFARYSTVQITNEDTQYQILRVEDIYSVANQ